MKTMNRFSRFALTITFATGLLLPFTGPAQTNSTPTTASPAADAPEAKPTQSFKSPSRLDEIAQLSKAGIGDPVILAYIKDSHTAYSLNAQDIIRLRDQGVSPEVTAALIQRGTEVRQAASEAIRPTQAEAGAAAPTYQTPPVIEQPAPVTYVPVVVKPASTVSVHYFGAPSYRYAPTHYYPRAYSSYVNYGPRYSYSSRASVSIGFGGGHFGGPYSRARYCR